MALFRSTHDALRFAYNFDGTNCTTAMLGIPPQGNGKGLGGLDGAAEVGNIKRIVESLGDQVKAWAEATYLPNRIPCHCGRVCCQGWSESIRWRNAVKEMAKLAFGVGKLEITKQFFSEKAYRKPVAEIAKIEDVSERQCYYLLKTVITFFRGTRKQRGVGQVFLESIDRELRKQGIVGDEE